MGVNGWSISEYVESHNVAIQIGDIFKHMKLPAFDSSDAAHVNIAALAKKAHAIKDDTKHAAAVDAVRDAADALLMKWLTSLQAKVV